MAAIRLTVNTDRLRYDLNTMETELSMINNEMQQISQDINALSGMWSGEAKDALLENFNETFAIVSEILEEHKDFLGLFETDKNEYNACEANVTSLMRGI